MKVGIIGLFPHQIADLKGRKLGHELEFLHEKAFHKDSIIPFCRRQQKVIIISASVHAVRDYVPVDKRHVMVGGVTSVIRMLAEWKRLLDPELTKIKPLKAEPVMANPKPVTPHEVTTVMSDELIAAAAGRASLRRPPPLESEEPSTPAVAPVFKPMPGSNRVEPEPFRVVYNPNARPMFVVPHTRTGYQNYKIVGAFRLGDMIRCTRPVAEGRILDSATWVQRLRAACKYYFEHRNGMTVEIHLWPAHADLICVHPAHGANHKVEDLSAYNGKQFRKYIPTAAELAADPTLAPAPVKPPKQRLSVGGTVNRFPEHAVVTPAPVTAFWETVFTAGLNQGKSLEDATEMANKAVTIRSTRFGLE